MFLTPRHRQELVAILAMLAGAFLGLTLLPWDLTGALGRVVGRFLWTSLGGGAALLPLLGIGAGLSGFGWIKQVTPGRFSVLLLGLTLLAPFLVAVLTGARTEGDFPALYADWTVAQRLSGIAPAATAVAVTKVLGASGAVLLSLAILSALTMYSLDWHPFRRLAAAPGDEAQPKPAPRQAPRVERADEPEEEESGEPDHRQPRRPPLPAFHPGVKHQAGEETEERFPSLELLLPPDRAQVEDWEEEIERQGQVLIETLATFRVEGTIVGRTTGPVVTQYEIAPAPGVKVGRIAALADDLALAMRAQSIRIVAPIPGRGAVGVEVPNPTPQIVTLREMLESQEWAHSRATLPIALGRDLEGKPIVADLAKMPHLLIAGATGSGKSICINTIITSLCYRYTPAELRMLMVDPKMVELALYNALPHLRHPVVTDNRQAAQVLKWAMIEMERRYELFHANGARGIADFNRYVRDGRELVDIGPNGRGRTPAGEDGQLPLQPPYTNGPLPYIVLIVDELADLMMTVQGEVEKPLAILAQKARATGIHLILATQRPSVNVITGLIKANFPCRIAFRVASKVDSRTIIDQNGAEALLGNGDGLFIPHGKNEPLRMQGAFISTEETEALTKWYAELQEAQEAKRAAAGLVPETEEDILETVQAREEEEASPAFSGGEGAADRDPLFREAAEVCVTSQHGSTSLLQRKLRIGYGRAARILDQLEEAGILSPPDGTKPREVLIGMGQLDEYCG